MLKTLYDNGKPIKTIAEQWQVSRLKWETIFSSCLSESILIESVL